MNTSKCKSIPYGQNPYRSQSLMQHIDKKVLRCTFSKWYELTIILFLLSIIFPTNSLAQNIDIEHLKEQVIESLSESIGEENDYSELVEELESFLINPININNASYEQLNQLRILTPFQVDALLKYRDKMGRFYTIYELKSLENIEKDQLLLLSYFIFFGEPNDYGFKSFSKNQINVRYNQQIEKAAGYIADSLGNKKFSGSPQKYLLKYKGSYKQFQYGLSAEKDPGESFFKASNPYGFDFYSGYLQYDGKKYLKRIIIGDYNIRFGQGLVLWGGYGFGKSAESITLMKYNQRIKAYSSTDENRFLRGISASFRLKPFDVSIFYSNHLKDGNLISPDTLDSEIASSLQLSGYHRTQDEIQDEKSIREQMLGISCRYRGDYFAIGVNGLTQKFNKALSPADRLYNQFKFKGDHNTNASIDYMIMLHRLHLYGEAAISESGGLALLSGTEFAPSTTTNFTLLYRNYSKNYHALNAYAFGEWTGVNNESGVYAGYRILPLPGWKITGYFDVYRSHWMRYTTNSPSKGNDLQVQLNYSPQRNLDFYLRYKNETNREKSSESSIIKQDVNQHVQRLRINANWQVNEQLRIKGRGEWSHFEKGNRTENGLLFFADMNYTSKKSWLTLWSRLAWFKSDGYDTRIYTYENDMPGYFYIPSFMYEGLRGYLSLKLKFSRSIQLWLKYGLTYLPDEDNFSSGYNKIESNKKQELKAHLRFSF